MLALGRLLAIARSGSVRSTGITVEMVEKLTTKDGYELLHSATGVLQHEFGWEVVGYKVGATSVAVQQRVGLKEPFWGPIFNKAVQRSPAEAARFSISRDLIRGVEAEFAFQIKRDIVPRSTPYSVLELMTDYCSTVTPCVEVCASRVQPAVQASTPVLIGDTGNLTVVFPPSAIAQDALQVYRELKSTQTSFRVDGEQVSTGSGADVLGGPELSLQWFANNVVNGDRQLTIREGEFVITGATCGLVPITKPCYAKALFSGAFNCELNLAFRE